MVLQKSMLRVLPLKWNHKKGLEENLDETCENQIEAEIARVAHPIMRLQGGIILLEDVYCAVNRARGTQLVSPEEVLLASRQIAQKYPQGITLTWS